MAGVRLLKGNYDDVVDYLDESGYEIYIETYNYLVVSDGTKFYKVYNDSRYVSSGRIEQWYIEPIDKISDPDLLAELLDSILPSDYEFKRLDWYDLFEEFKYYFNNSWEVYAVYLEDDKQVSEQLYMDISQHAEYIFLTDGRYQYFVKELTDLCNDWVNYINEDDISDFATKIIEHEGSVPAERLPELVDYFINHFAEMKLDMYIDDIANEIVSELKELSIEYGYDIDIDYDNRIIDIYYI